MPFIKAAKAASNRTLNLLGTPWTAPSWTKDNNDTLPGFLIPSYQDAFTNYIIKLVGLLLFIDTCHTSCYLRTYSIIVNSDL